MYKFMQLFCLFWLFLLTVHSLAAAAGLQDTASSSILVARGHVGIPAQRFHHLQARDQAAGSSCSSEGQWNCMTNSWQRCAAGRWSATMQCAKGTTCSPAGLTNDFRIQHDGSVNGNGGPPTTSEAPVTTSLGTRRWVSKVGIGVWGLGWWWVC